MREDISKRGDIVWVSFDPQQGREQAGHWPALVLSPYRYNERGTLLLTCPITRQVKGYPWEMKLPDGLGAQGAVLADQIRALDYRARTVEFFEQAPWKVTEEVLSELEPLLGRVHKSF